MEARNEDPERTGLEGEGMGYDGRRDRTQSLSQRVSRGEDRLSRGDRRSGVRERGSEKTLPTPIAAPHQPAGLKGGAARPVTEPSAARAKRPRP